MSAMKENFDKAMKLQRDSIEQQFTLSAEDALFVANALYEAIQETAPQFDMMKSQLAFLQTPYTDEDGNVWEAVSAEQHAQVCKQNDLLKTKTEAVKEAVLICAKAVSN